MRDILDWKSGHGYDRIRLAREEATAAAIEHLKNAFGAREFLDAPGYYVTPCGAVYSTRCRRVLRLREGTKPGGYRFFGATVGTERVYFMTHRAVALTFIPNPLGLPEVNHIDGDKRNNAVKNLEWVDRAANARHAVETGLVRRVGYGGRRLSKEQIEEIRVDARPYRLIAEQHGISAQTVCNIKGGRGARKEPKAA